MNVLFLTITPLVDLNTPSIYIGILKQFRDDGHKVYVVSPYEKKLGKETELVEHEGITFLHAKTGNMIQCGMIEKGISILRINSDYQKGINKYLGNKKFDLILYSTPPITLCNVIKKIKVRDKARTYLMLKDIFPQNAVDMGLFNRNSVIYKYFRSKEKKLYKISDLIGCMSPANMDYVIKNNPDINGGKICLCPNSADDVEKSISKEKKVEIRAKYGIPVDKTVFVYGGNLGKPQGIPFLIECLRECKDLDVQFLIVGSGTESEKINSYCTESKQRNIKLLERLPKEEYDTLVAACDVGMIFLDYCFTIPNYPSRLLPYLQAKLPILAVTDQVSDIGKIAEENGYGWRCDSNNAKLFVDSVKEASKSDLETMGERGYLYFKQNYTSEGVYNRMKDELTELDNVKG